MFDSFFQTEILLVTLAISVLSVSSALVGTFTFLKKQALVGDAIAHGILPGICIAFLLTGVKNPLVLSVGAFVSGWISVLAIDWIKSKSVIKEDAAIAIVLSVFFGFGILLLTFIQGSGNANQSGLNSFLFGSASALVKDDLIVFGGLSAVLFLMVFLFYKELKLITFNPSYAKVIGVPVKFFEMLLSVLTVLAVVVGIKAVGVVLMASILITPTAAAKFWTNKMSSLIILSSIIAAISSVFGVMISLSRASMPTGPWIVVCLSLIAIFSFFIAPEKGIIGRNFKQKRLRRKIEEDNLLKEIYHLGEKSKDLNRAFSIQEILNERFFEHNKLKTLLTSAEKKNWLEQNPKNRWKFTGKGKKIGQRLVKIHRLWELYLTKHMNIASDHVHEDAETIEHIITPEIEMELEKILEYPTADPHQKQIPY